MLYTKILIEIETGKLMNAHRGTAEITNKHPDLYEWIDYTDNEGNPQDLPEDWNTETISDTGEITTPVYIWDGKELINVK